MIGKFDRTRIQPSGDGSVPDGCFFTQNLQECSQCWANRFNKQYSVPTIGLTRIGKLIGLGYNPRAVFPTHARLPTGGIFSLKTFNNWVNVEPTVITSNTGAQTWAWPDWEIWSDWGTTLRQCSRLPTGVFWVKTWKNWLNVGKTVMTSNTVSQTSVWCHCKI